MTEPMIEASCQDAAALPSTAEHTSPSSRPSSLVSAASDNDGAERPVREKFKKTSLAALSGQGKMDEGNASSDQAGVKSSTAEDREREDAVVVDAVCSPRGRPTRKRSFDDLHNESTTVLNASASDAGGRAEIYHKRMRSRDEMSTRNSTVNGKLDKEKVVTLVEEEDNMEAKTTPKSGPEEGKAPVGEREPPQKMQPRDQVEGEGDVKDHKLPIGNESSIAPQSSDENNAGTVGDQSPKRKRSRDQFDHDSAVAGFLQKEANQGVPEKEQPKADERETQSTINDDKGEPDKKRHRETSQDRKDAADGKQVLNAVEKSSGFANTSSMSPFQTVTSGSTAVENETLGSDSASQENKQTSSTAFASSGLSAFAGSSKSPFGNLGGSGIAGSSSGFGSFAAKEKTGFGSSFAISGASAFTSRPTSGFATLGGSGFGSALGSKTGGSKLGPSSFAPAGGSGGFIGAGAPTKPFGAPDDEGENDDENNDAASFGAEDDADERDNRFYKQQVETGEEEEETIFSCRAKLFQLVDKEWKERGLGTVKLNIHYTSTPTLTTENLSVEEDVPDLEQQQPTSSSSSSPPPPPEQQQQQQPKARLVMRTDGVHRVVLNTPIFKSMKFGTADGLEPTGKIINLTGIDDGKPALFLLKIGKEEVVKDLYHKIEAVHDEL